MELPNQLELLPAKNEGQKDFIFFPFKQKGNIKCLCDAEQVPGNVPALGTSKDEWSPQRALNNEILQLLLGLSCRPPVGLLLGGDMEAFSLLPSLPAPHQRFAPSPY